MFELLVQSYLRSFPSVVEGLLALKDKYSIKATFSKKYPELFLLKYDTINSDFSDLLTRQCRGLILNSKDLSVVCCSYFKFFNTEEPLASSTQFDWASAKIFEKRDGSLVCLYFYKGIWNISTSGTPDGNAMLPDSKMAYAELFWKIWKDSNYGTPSEKNYTFAFELCSPWNRVVVKYSEHSLHLHGVRNNDTLREEDIEPFSDKYNWKRVKFYKFGTATSKALCAEANKFNGLENEGFVVVDKDFNRFKIKSENYLKYHHLRASTSMSSLLQVVLNGETAEVLAYFPEFIPKFEMIKSKIVEYSKKIMDEYHSIKHTEVQKDFAARAMGLTNSGLLFAFRGGKIKSVQEGLQRMPIKNVKKLLGLDNLELREIE